MSLQESLPATGNKLAEKRRAIFMHTQKTAGSSILDMARTFYGNDKVIGFDQHARLSHQALVSVPFLSGHFGFEFAKAFMPDRYSFTFLRDPIERVLSLYAYIISRPAGEYDFFDEAKKAGLEGFLQERRFRTHVWNNQVWQLAYGWCPTLVGSPAKETDDFDPEYLFGRALLNLARFNYVGFLDTLADDAGSIFRALGWGSPEIPHTNASPRREMFADLSDSQIAALHEATGLDQRLFEYAKRVYPQANKYRPTVSL